MAYKQPPGGGGMPQSQQQGIYSQQAYAGYQPQGGFPSHYQSSGTDQQQGYQNQGNQSSQQYGDQYPPQDMGGGQKDMPPAGTAMPPPGTQQQQQQQQPEMAQGVPAPRQNRVCVFGEQYCLPYDCTLIMYERGSWAIQGMDVLDIQGQRHFRIGAKVMSYRDKRVLTNALGQIVCCSFEKAFSMHHRTYICPGEDYNTASAIATAKKVILSAPQRMEVHYKENDNGPPDFTMVGSFFARDFQIFDRSGPIATIMRQSSMFSFSGMDRYGVVIRGGVDTALIVMLVCIIEEVMVLER